MTSVEFNLDYNYNTHMNRVDVAETTAHPKSAESIWTKELQHNDQALIGKLLRKKPKARIADVKPAAPTTTPKEITQESETPPPDKQTTAAEKLKMEEAKKIKEFSQLIEDAKKATPSEKVEINDFLAEYIRREELDSTFDEKKTITDELGNTIFIGVTKSGNIIEVTEGVNGDNIEMRSITIKTEDGSLISFTEVADDTTYHSTISAGSRGENQNSGTMKSITVSTNLETEAVTRISTSESKQNINGEFQNKTVYQTFDTEGNEGPIIFEQNSGNRTQSGGSSFSGTINENGDFVPDSDTPLNSWERNASTITYYDSEGNIVSEENLPQKQIPTESQQEATTAQNSNKPYNVAKNNDGQIHNTGTYSQETPIDLESTIAAKEELPHAESEYAFGLIQTNLLNRATN